VAGPGVGVHAPLMHLCVAGFCNENKNDSVDRKCKHMVAPP
jgi:hypothetical protein